jgi:hypothetical protein
VCWKPCSSCWSLYLLRQKFLSAPIHSPPPSLVRRFGPSSAQGLFGPVRPRSLRASFSCLLQLSPNCMWVLDVSFSALWIGLLVVLQHFPSMSSEFSAFTNWSLGLLESCSPRVLTCTGLQDLLAMCSMNSTRKSSFRCLIPM